jgi:hypothetical protein
LSNFEKQNPDLFKGNKQNQEEEIIEEEEEIEEEKEIEEEEIEEKIEEEEIEEEIEEKIEEEIEEEIEKEIEEKKEIQEKQKIQEGNIMISDEKPNENQETRQSRRKYSNLTLRYLYNVLQPDLSNLQELVDQLMNSIEEDLKKKRFLKIEHHLARKDKLPPPTVRRELDPKGHRIRQRWNTEEDRILIQGHQEHSKCKRFWGKICILMLNRTHVDCKDRWRTLIKKHKSKETVYELLKVMNTEQVVVSEQVAVSSIATQNTIHWPFAHYITL